VVHTVLHKLGKPAGNSTSVHCAALPQEGKPSNAGLNFNRGKISSRAAFCSLLQGFSRAKFPLWRIR